jgi:hypothetical protein
MIGLNTSAQKKGTAVVILCLIAVFLISLDTKPLHTPLSMTTLGLSMRKVV